MENTESIKKALGQKACELIKDHMVVGLGSGSTANCFINSLIEKKLDIVAVSSSDQSLQLAKKGGIKTLPLNEVAKIDITVDGADEIDPKNRMIKGGGGCHLQEKILASSSSEVVILADHTKLSDKLGREKLPVEVVYYGAVFTEKTLRKKGYKGEFRKSEDGTLFFTDNANLIYDIEFSSGIDDPENTHLDLLQVPGVIETGFFFNIASKILIGLSDNQIESL